MTHKNSDNVIHFAKFKSMYDENSANKCFKEYLDVLTFSELIEESNQVMAEIEKINKLGKVDDELTTQSRLIFKEFEKRTVGNRKLIKIREETENKIINLKDHL